LTDPLVDGKKMAQPFLDLGQFMAHSPKLESTSSNWNQYGSWNRRHEGLAEAWVRDLIQWLGSHPLVNSQTSVLDFGCGYFDVGLALAAHVSRVDGFDVSSEACNIAAQRARVHSSRSQIFQRSSDIPSESYDIIIVNSVIQYFSDLDCLQDHFSLWKSLLKDKPNSQIVIADIIPSNYISWRDAFRSLEVAWRERMLWPMVTHLGKAATKPKALSLLQIDFEVICKFADAIGFKAKLLPINLTPSRQRYSVVVSKE
jgi:SAM-dependent methyltransferase